MLNFDLIQKINPPFFIKKVERKLTVKKGHKMQSSSRDTRDRFILVLTLDAWITYKDVVTFTGLSKGTISRAASHLLDEGVIIKETIWEGRLKSTSYKLKGV